MATKIHTFGGRSKFTTWLHAVASNSARSTYRTLKRRAGERLSDEMPVHADPRTTSVIAGSAPARGARRSWWQHLPRAGGAAGVRDVQELDYNEIARLLDTPLGTVKSRIHAARQAVRPLLVVRDA